LEWILSHRVRNILQKLSQWMLTEKYGTRNSMHSNTAYLLHEGIMIAK